MSGLHLEAWVRPWFWGALHSAQRLNIVILSFRRICYPYLDMRSLEYIPRPHLRPFVRLIWILEVDELPDSSPPERITPDGLVELVFHYREPLACRYDGDEFSKQPRSVVISQTRRFVEIKSVGPVGLLSVRFQPWGACHFFDSPISEFADRQISAEELWGGIAIKVQQRLADCSSSSERVGLVEAFLTEQLSTRKKRNLEQPVRAIWRHQGQVSVPTLCQELGVGERSLQRMFSEGIGMSPKAFARLSRFLFTCARLRRRQEGCVLSEIGVDSGYYDQSHFNADFKTFSGMTPAQFLQTHNLSFLEPD